ncbi:porin [Tenacibaculum insulae]|uniref:porin n=1 Tax=Tenacibaculum insulae TaxID=2029677 RepID=UPI003AB4D502
MKTHQKLLFFITMLCTILVQGQEPTLNKYKFGEGFKFTGKSGYKMELSGFIQPYTEVKSYTDENESSVTRFRMRRARLRISGSSADSRWSYRFSFDLSGSGEVEGDNASALMDALVSYKIVPRITLSFGQRSTYTDNRELFLASNTLMLVERSRVTSSFAAIREFGLFAQGNFRISNQSYLRPYLMLTNGDGINAFGNDHGGLKVGGRLDYLPFGLFYTMGQFRQADVVRELVPRLVVGVAYSKNNGMSSRRGRESGSILYLDANDDELLPDYEKFGVDFLFKYSGFTAFGEYVTTSAVVPKGITQRLRNDGTASTSFDVDGTEDVDAYVKGKMMLGSGFNFQMGYLFKNGISIDARYTQLDASENSFLNNATFYNRPEYITGGISKYLDKSHAAKLQMSLTHVKGDGINNGGGNPIEGNEWIGRMMLTYAF